VDVAARSEGNAYFVDLLVRSAPEGTGLPSEVPEALRSALTARWHGMGRQARDLVRVLAVAGRPVAYDVLADVAERAGLPADVLDDSLREAAGAGVIEPRGPLTWWFHHPLLAEVLGGSLMPGERRRLHLAFVDVLG